MGVGRTGLEANWKLPRECAYLIEGVARTHPATNLGGRVCSCPPDAHPALSSNKYYMSARHMALAKAFPEYFTYEPHEADAVSGSRGPFWRGQELERGVWG